MPFVKGPVTPAIRAGIIERLIEIGYINRENRELIATAKGISLIRLLNRVGLDLLCSPELTSEWEYKLRQIERGELDRPAFMTQFKELTREIVDKMMVPNFPKWAESKVLDGNYGILDVPCPKCGAAELKEAQRMYRCKNCGYLLFKHLAARELNAGELTILIKERKVGPLEGFRTKAGRPLSALVVLNAENRPQIAFEVDKGKHSLTGPCQVCHTGLVFDIGSAYVCENVSKGSCTFQMSKLIFQREVPPSRCKSCLRKGKAICCPDSLGKKGNLSMLYLL